MNKVALELILLQVIRFPPFSISHSVNKVALELILLRVIRFPPVSISHSVNKVALELILLQVIRFPPVNIRHSVLHIQFYVINPLTIRTSGRSLGTVLKAVLFVQRGGLDRNVLSLFFSLK